MSTSRKQKPAPKSDKPLRLLTTVIREDEWARGGKNGCGRVGEGGTGLVNYDLPEDRPVRCTRCCLGFDAEQRGLTRDEIGDKGMPNECLDMSMPRREVREFAKDWRRSTARKGLDDLVEKSGATRLEGLAVSINDDEAINDEVRLERLRRVFKAAGRRIVFIKSKLTGQKG